MGSEKKETGSRAESAGFCRWCTAIRLTGLMDFRMLDKVHKPPAILSGGGVRSSYAAEEGKQYTRPTTGNGEVIQDLSRLISLGVHETKSV
jgi:hypothetical protein